MVNKLICDKCGDEIKTHYLLELMKVTQECDAGFNSTTLFAVDLCSKCSKILKKKLEKELKL